MRKIVYGAMAAAALTLAVGIGSTSASAQTPNVTVDYANEKLTVSGESGQLMVAYPKVKGEGADATVKVSAWDAYTQKVNSNYVVDLSALNLTKDNYVLVKGTSTATDPLLIKLSTIDGKAKAKYNAKTGKIAGATADLTNAELATYQYRTATGNWTEIQESNGLDLSSFQMVGATLYLRTAPEKNNSQLQAKSDANVGGYAYAEVEKAFPGKELKVKIAKLANGPKVAVNYDKKTVTIPKNAEYAQDTNTPKKFPADGAALSSLLGNTSWEWTKATDKVEVALNTDQNTGALTKTLVALRTGATDKKLASKITMYAYADGAKLQAQNNNSGENDITLLNAATNGITLQLTPAGSTNSANVTGITVTYDAIKKGITIKNDTETAFNVVTNAAKDKKDADLVSEKAKVVKAKSSLTIKGVDGQYVYLRTASNKKTEAFASNYVVVGKVIAPTPSPSPQS